MYCTWVGNVVQFFVVYLGVRWCTLVYLVVPGCTLVYLDIAELYTLQFLLEVETMQIRK